jgi:DegV family protein with EDD domain
MESKDGRRIAIVTDSTADLPSHLVEEYGIRVVPQVLIMGDRTWRDGVDIDSATFYELLRTSSHFPASSQPSVVDFQQVFGELAGDFDGIVAVLISDELSGTLNSARMAAESLPDVPIEIIDTRAVSLQLAFIVLAAARAAAAGGDLQTVADAARAMIGQAQIYFIVDTLEYLHRGGRIGAASRLFGTALNLKPVLTISDGVVTPLTKVRSRRKALATVVRILDEQLAGAEGVHMGVLHVACPDEAAVLAEHLEERFRPVEMFRTECGPVIGTHAGPGTVGVAVYADGH